MAKNQKPSQPETVAEFCARIEHPLIEAILTLREIILGTDTEIEEHIKWNSLAFYYKGEMKPFAPREYKRDIVVFNLHKNEFILLVFPTGAKIEDTSGLLQGNFPDSRKVIRFTSSEEVSAGAEALQNILRKWLSMID